MKRLRDAPPRTLPNMRASRDSHGVGNSHGVTFPKFSSGNSREKKLSRKVSRGDAAKSENVQALFSSVRLSFRPSVRPYLSTTTPFSLPSVAGGSRTDGRCLHIVD